MSTDMSQPDGSTAWEESLRTWEEQLRVAFLAADIAALDAMLADGYLVNSPLQRVIGKAQLLELLRLGRIRHSAFEVTIECIHRSGDVAVVMGHDSVIDPPDGTRSHRRFTNLWQHEGGSWRSIARHAHVVSTQPAG